MFIDELFAANSGLATTTQLLAVMSRKSLAAHVSAGALIRVWHGVYAMSEPDTITRLAALDLMTGKKMGTPQPVSTVSIPKRTDASTCWIRAFGCGQPRD